MKKNEIYIVWRVLTWGCSERGREWEEIRRGKEWRQREKKGKSWREGKKKREDGWCSKVRDSGFLIGAFLPTTLQIDN